MVGNVGGAGERYFLKKMFNLSLTPCVTFGSFEYRKSASLSPSSLFFDAPPKVEHYHEVSEVCGSSLPSNAYPVYRNTNPDSDAVALFEMSYGAGRVVGMSFSWRKSRLSRAEWPELLRMSARKFTAGASQVLEAFALLGTRGCRVLPRRCCVMQNRFADLFTHACTS